MPLCVQVDSCPDSVVPWPYDGYMPLTNGDDYRMDVTRLGALDDALDTVSAMAKDYDHIALRVLGVETDVNTLAPAGLFFLSMIPRIRGLHDGAVRETRAENPHGAFTLLRTWAEDCALVLYVTDKPVYIERLQRKRKDLHRKRIQSRQLIEHVSGRITGLDVVYAELSEMSHFGSAAFWNAFRLDEDSDSDPSRSFGWTSFPRFKDEQQALIACGWIWELAEVSRHVLQEFAEAHLLPDDSTDS